VGGNTWAKTVSFFKKFVIWKLCFLLVVPLNSWSQAQPAAQPDRVGRAVSGVLQDGLRSRGFAANDPRFANTLSRVSPVIAGVAGTAAVVTVGAVSAPAWVTVGIAMVVGAVVTYVVNLGLDSLVKWFFRPDGKIDESSDPPASSPGAALVKDGPYWQAIMDSTGGWAYAGDGQRLARQANAANRANSHLRPDSQPTCTYNSGGKYWSCGAWGTAYQRASGAPSSCLSGSMYFSGSCSAFTEGDPSQNPPVPASNGLPIGTAIAHIPASDYEKQLNPVVVAAMADQAWQNAASQPGYDGVPYPQSNPITAPEAQKWNDANSGYAPTVRDFVSPNPSSTANSSPFSLPLNPAAPVTTPVPANNPATINPAAANPLANLGADPVTPQPTLETTPTAHQILTPLIGVMPDLRNFQIPNHPSKCPVPEFDVWSNHFKMNAHCTLIENNLSTIQATFTLLWALLALFIVLSA